MVTDDGTGYPVLTYKQNGEYSEYFTVDHIEYGKWEICDDTLILKLQISKRRVESNRPLFEKLIKKGLVFKGNHGEYYQKPIELNIKKITNSRLEFGNEKIFSIYDRIK